jgi:hypothetical protein
VRVIHERERAAAFLPLNRTACREPGAGRRDRRANITAGGANPVTEGPATVKDASRSRCPSGSLRRSSLWLRTHGGRTLLFVTTTNELTPVPWKRTAVCRRSPNRRWRPACRRDRCAAEPRDGRHRAVTTVAAHLSPYRPPS